MSIFIQQNSALAGIAVVFLVLNLFGLPISHENGPVELAQLAVLMFACATAFRWGFCDYPNSAKHGTNRRIAHIVLFCVCSAGFMREMNFGRAVGLNSETVAILKVFSISTFLVLLLAAASLLKARRSHSSWHQTGFSDPSKAPAFACLSVLTFVASQMFEDGNLGLPISQFYEEFFEYIAYVFILNVIRALSDLQSKQLPETPYRVW